MAQGDGAAPQPDRIYPGYRARRHARATVVMAAVLLALAGAFYYASTYFRASEPSSGPCTTKPPVVALKPADVSVNVYNATNRRGLALATSKTVLARGFKVAAVANDPKGATIKAVAQIRYGPAGAESARLLYRHVPGAVFFNDKRKADTIDLVLGNAWKNLGPVPSPTPTKPGLPPCPTITVTAG